MIQQLLQQLGFTEKESDVYLAILQQGKISHADVAKITNINRTTVYAAVKQLVHMGVIYEDSGSSTTYLLARPPEQLRIIVDTEKAALVQKNNIVNQAVTELQTLVKTPRYSIPKMNFIDEDQLQRHLYDKAPTWNTSIMKTDGIWWGFQDHTFVEEYQEWIDWFWQECAPKELCLQLLSNESPVERNMKKKKYERRNIQFWSQAEQFTGTTWVTGDYLIMIITQQHPFYLIEIHDAVLAHNMRQVFSGIWAGFKKS